jgi:hypothetical protein
MFGGLADALVGEGAKSDDSQICMMLTPRHSSEGGWSQILVIKMNWGAPRAGFARGVFDFSLPSLGAFLFLLISRLGELSARRSSFRVVGVHHRHVHKMFREKPHLQLVRADHIAD